MAIYEEEEMQQARDEELQWMYLIQEFDMSISALKSGLAVLQRSDQYRRNEFVYLLLLSTALERLMKIVLHLHSVQTQGSFLPSADFRKFSHNLTQLCQEVVSRCFNEEYLQRPFAQIDRTFIETDGIFRTLLQILNDFAKSDRYIYLDSIADPNLPDAADRWPSRRWNLLELTRMYDEYELWPGEDEAIQRHRLVTRDFVSCIERFVRSIGRLFAFGVLGQGGKMVSSSIGEFTRLSDEALGNSTYEI